MEKTVNFRFHFHSFKKEIIDFDDGFNLLLQTYSHIKSNHFIQTFRDGSGISEDTKLGICESWTLAENFLTSKWQHGLNPESIVLKIFILWFFSTLESSYYRLYFGCWSNVAEIHNKSVVCLIYCSRKITLNDKPRMSVGSFFHYVDQIAHHGPPTYPRLTLMKKFLLL